MEERLPPEAETDEWYRDREDNLFKVVALESEDTEIEIQYYDGTLEELDSQGWRERQPRTAEPPEDWSGAVDISREDFRTSNDEPTEPDEEDMLNRLDGLE
ncbi:MAG: DUF6763 family protein [Gammaproteobacteria bacterium]